MGVKLSRKSKSDLLQHTAVCGEGGTQIPKYHNLLGLTLMSLMQY